jgi:hypothetical protein
MHGESVFCSSILTSFESIQGGHYFFPQVCVSSCCGSFTPIFTSILPQATFSSASQMSSWICRFIHIFGLLFRTLLIRTAKSALIARLPQMTSLSLVCIVDFLTEPPEASTVPSFLDLSSSGFSFFLCVYWKEFGIWICLRLEGAL